MVEDRDRWAEAVKGEAEGDLHSRVDSRSRGDSENSTYRNDSIPTSPQTKGLENMRGVVIYVRFF